MFYIKRSAISVITSIYFKQRLWKIPKIREFRRRNSRNISRKTRERDTEREQVQFLLVNYGSIKKKDSAKEEILVLKMLLHLNTGK